MNEVMQAALVAEGVCWSSGDPVIVETDDPRADADARNNDFLRSYVRVARCKGKTIAEFASAIASKYRGDAAPLDEILALPNV
jgi:hypothetical protein